MAPETEEKLVDANTDFLPTTRDSPKHYTLYSCI